VFEKFYRVGNEATKKAKGTGLGLYLTKRIIDAHAGKIWVEDFNPSGSVFVVQLKQVV
jgi:signal transduction histidine kinase